MTPLRFRHHTSAGTIHVLRAAGETQAWLVWPSGQERIALSSAAILLTRHGNLSLNACTIVTGLSLIPRRPLPFPDRCTP